MIHLMLISLLTVPAADPTTVGIYRYDGAWTIVAVERDGKTIEANAPVTVKNHRLVMNEGKGQQITIEFDGNNRAWLWAGGKKPPTTPPPPEEIPLAVGQRIWMPGGEMWIIDPLSRMPMPAPTITVRPRYVTLAEPGIYFQDKDQMQIFFLGLGGDGPSLTLSLKRPAEKKP